MEKILRIFKLASFVASLLVLTSCGGGGGGGGGVSQSSVGISTQMAVIASGTAGPAGGVIADTQQETIVRVPPGAVANDVLIEIRRGFDAEGHVVTDFVSSADTGPVEITLPDTAFLSANLTTGAATTNGVVAALAVTPCNPFTDSTCYPITEPTDAANEAKFSCNSAFNGGWFKRCAKFWAGHRIDNLFVTTPLAAFQMANSTPALNDAKYKPAAALSSYCKFQDATCYGGKEPVLFIHGYTSFDTLGGGQGTFGALPNLVLKAGYLPFEFRWSTDARFEDVARDLEAAITQIARETGMQVHIVAHSFGGVLARTYLQGLADKFDTNKVATLTTLGTPHSGIFDSRSFFDSASSVAVDANNNPVLPFGRDEQRFSTGSVLDGCGQLSCYQMGADVGLTGGRFNATHGEIAVGLSMATFASAIHVQSLIGLTTCRGGNGIMDEGDGLVSYQGQRFKPADTLNKISANYFPLRRDEKNGEAWISEAVLGTGADLKPGDPNPYSAPARDGYMHNSTDLVSKLLTLDAACNWGAAIEMAKPVGNGYVGNSTLEHQGWASVRDWLAAYHATPVVSQTIFVSGMIQNAVTAAPVERALVWIKFGSSAHGIFSKPDGSFAADIDFKPYTKYSVTIQATGFRNGEFDLGTTTMIPTPIDTFNLQVMPVSTPPLSFDLRVDITGTGSGNVTGIGIACPSDCMENFAPGTAVTLTAQPATGSIFAGWSGCASTNGTACYLNMNNSMPVTANFAATTTVGAPPPPPCTLPQVLQNGVCVTPPVTTPAPPGSITSFTGSPYCDTKPPSNTGAVQLNWASSGAISYEVFRDGIRLAGGVTQTGFKNNLTDLAGQTHNYFIRAHNSTTATTDSSIVSVAVPSNVCATGTPPPLPCTPPQALTNGVCVTQPPTDTTSPTINSFSVSPSTGTLGQSFTISYTVSDSGGSGLKQIGLWRANINGASNDSSWAQIGSAVPLSGNGPYSSVFSDAPPAVGNYWYGIHVIDNANPTVVAHEAVPLPVTVTSSITAPAVQSLAATLVTSTSAQMNGSINPNGLSTSAYFEYGTTTGYGGTTGSGTFSGTSAIGIQSGWTGLTPNTTYHYRAVATNSGGTNRGADVAFTTPATPLVINGVASNYSAIGAAMPYRPTISLTGSGFNSITQISWSCANPNGSACLASPYIWSPGTAKWNNLTITSDTVATVYPTFLEATDPAGTYNWSVTFSGGGQSVTKYFTVTK